MDSSMAKRHLIASIKVVGDEYVLAYCQNPMVSVYEICNVELGWLL